MRVVWCKYLNMKSKDDILLEQAYSKILKEYVDERDDGPFYKDDSISFEDPFGKPFIYYVEYEKKMESGFYDDSVIGVTINSAKVFKNDGDEIGMDITNETNPSLSDIQDWVYNHEIGDSRLNLL
jgi:hypothetical protein